MFSQKVLVRKREVKVWIIIMVSLLSYPWWTPQGEKEQSEPWLILEHFCQFQILYLFEMNSCSHFPVPGDHWSVSCLYRFAFCLYRSVSVSIDFSFGINAMIYYVVFCVWFHPLSIMFFAIHPYCSTLQYFTPLYGQIIVHCMDIPHLIYSFIYQSIIVLFTLYSYNESYCNEFSCTFLCMDMTFQFS